MKQIAALTSGVVPDLMENSDQTLLPQSAWADKLLDTTDVVETQRSGYLGTALNSVYCYDAATKRRGYYGVPIKAGVVPFHFWQSLVEKAGQKISEIPKTWDAFLDFFGPVQTRLRAIGMRNVYAYGYQLSSLGNDPNNTFAGFLIAYGGKDLVTFDGMLHTENPEVRQAAERALAKVTTAYKDGFVPSQAVDWNDVDSINAFRSKLTVMNFASTISTELGLYRNKAEYDDIVTRGLPLSNEGKELPSQLINIAAIVPKAAKNVAVAKEFSKYLIEPQVLNAYVKGGLGRYFPPMPELAKNDPFWLASGDPHRSAYVRQGLFSPTMPQFQAFNPAFAQVYAEHAPSRAALAIIKRAMTPREAVEMLFKLLVEIFAKYPIERA